MKRIGRALFKTIIQALGGIAILGFLPTIVYFLEVHPAIFFIVLGIVGLSFIFFVNYATDGES